MEKFQISVILYLVIAFQSCECQVCNFWNFSKVLNNLPKNSLILLKIQINLYKLECVKQNESEYVTNSVCEFYKNSKGSTFISFYSDLLIPVKYATINISVIYQSDKIFIDNHFEYCSSFSNLPPYASVLFGVLKTFSKDLIQPCPYTPKKRLGIENLSIDSFSIFLTAYKLQMGNYRTSISIHDRKGKLITYMIFHTSVSRRRPQKGSQGR